MTSTVNRTYLPDEQLASHLLTVAHQGPVFPISGLRVFTLQGFSSLRCSPSSWEITSLSAIPHLLLQALQAGVPGLKGLARKLTLGTSWLLLNGHYFL